MIIESLSQVVKNHRFLLEFENTDLKLHFLTTWERDSTINDLPPESPPSPLIIKFSFLKNLTKSLCVVSCKKRLITLDKKTQAPL